MSVFSKIFIAGSFFLFSFLYGYGQNSLDLGSAHLLLKTARTQVLALKRADEKIDKLLDLGLWTEAEALLSKERPGHEKSLLEARYLILQSRFNEAELIVDEVLAHSRSNQSALLLKTQLLVQKWKLPDAEIMAADLIKRNDKNIQAAEALGTIYLLEKNYVKATALASLLQTTFPMQAEGFLLEVKVLFSTKLGEGAEPILKKAIMLAPLNVDCRYFYGYLLWRKGQKALLGDMQDQWNFALEINPLYYLIHWHLGNGYTNARFSDYTAINNPVIIEALKTFDPLISSGKITTAIALCSSLKTSYPISSLPYIYAGSAWYLASSLFKTEADKTHALDSARTDFRTAVRISPLSGMAHNGLASVLNAERLAFLYFSDSIKQHLLTNIKVSPDFTRVFTGVDYYPGKLVPAMVWSEMHASTAYLPLLALEKRIFTIIPLHHTLAESLNEPYFNTGITFDNRQWMDIRGVGSGAVGIEYLLAGGYRERNVLLHEFTHLFHHDVLTEQQQRRIRSLYYAAMKNKATLDYYASNNEDEYFAQAYESFFDAVKVHPLDYKSMNTRAELKAKDPKAYGFIDSLVNLSAASESNAQLLKDNYAQVYANIVQEELNKPVPGKTKIKDALNKAIAYNASYLPLLISKANFAIQQKDYTTAETILRNAENLNTDYAPVYTGNATLNRALFEDGLLEQSQGFDLQNTWLLKALSVEKDLQLKANLANAYVDFLVLNCKYPLAINSALEYTAHAPTISTYLRDAKLEIQTKAVLLKCLLGYAEGLPALTRQARDMPVTSTLIRLAEAYAANKNFLTAIETLEPMGIENLKKKNSNTILLAHLCVYEAAAGNISKAQIWYTALAKPLDSSIWYSRAMLGAGKAAQALLYLNQLPVPMEPEPRSFYYQCQGLIYLRLKNDKSAIISFKSALDNNPYDYTSAINLIDIYTRTGKNAEINFLKARLINQELKPGENIFN